MIFTAAQAAVADGRVVIAVATTAKSVAKRAETGLAAPTIARLRLDLHHAPLRPGTTVVLDEVSQTSTRDMHTVLAAVAVCPRRAVVGARRPRQAPAAKAGAIATELERQIHAGAIPAVTLTVNRRQLRCGGRRRRRRACQAVARADVTALAMVPAEAARNPLTTPTWASVQISHLLGS